MCEAEVEKLKKKKKDKSIINVGDFNTSLPKFEKNRKSIII